MTSHVHAHVIRACDMRVHMCMCMDVHMCTRA